MRKLALVFVLAFAPAPALVSAQEVSAQDVARTAEARYSGFVEQVKLGSMDPLLLNAKIAVSVKNSPQGKNNIFAGVFGCDAVSDCEILVSEKMVLTFDEDELFGALAHEVKHVSQLLRGQMPDGRIEREYAADEFAMELLRKYGRRETAVITGLRKVVDESVFAAPENLKQFRLRIRNARKFLGAR